MRCYFCQTNIEQNKVGVGLYYCTQCPKGHVSHAFTSFDKFDQPYIAHIYIDKLHDHNPSPGVFSSQWINEDGKYHIRYWTYSNTTDINYVGKGSCISSNITTLTGFPFTIDNAYERLLTILTFS